MVSDFGLIKNVNIWNKLQREISMFKPRKKTHYSNGEWFYVDSPPPPLLYDLSTLNSDFEILATSFFTNGSSTAVVFVVIFSQPSTYLATVTFP